MMQELEEKIAHLIRAVDDLSETVAHQDTMIAMLNRRVQMLIEREADRESMMDGQALVGDNPPPHW